MTAADDYSPRPRAVRALMWDGNVLALLAFIEGVEGIESVTFNVQTERPERNSVIISGGNIRKNGVMGMATTAQQGEVIVHDSGELFVLTGSAFDAQYKPVAEIAEPKHCRGCGNDDGPIWCEGVTG